MKERIIKHRIWTGVYCGAIIFRMQDTPITQKLLSALKIGPGFNYYSEDIERLIDSKPGNIAWHGGVICKKNENFFLLLITLNKAPNESKYVDHLENNVLFWEGQTNRKVLENSLERGDGKHIFVFIRSESKTNNKSVPYQYYGRALPLRMIKEEKGKPSKVVFELFEYDCQSETTASGLILPQSCLREPDVPYNVPPRTTENRIVQIRTAQSKYREDALKLWGNQCAVTQVSNPKVLIASHIKPWREASDSERVNPYNSLILSPTYDKLFDLGFITFDYSNGRIKLSKQLDDNDWDRLGVDDTKELRFVPDETVPFLRYHRTYVYGFKNEQGNINDLLVN